MDTKVSDEFTELYLVYKNVLERYIYYKISNPSDAEDVLQITLESAFANFKKLSDRKLFKQWLIRIASNKCIDYYKRKAAALEIPLDNIPQKQFNARGDKVNSIVQDTLQLLPEKNKQILYLFYLMGFSQKEIALRLDIPLGTVKSRVNSGKVNFKKIYPYPPPVKSTRGNDIMKSNLFPQFIPNLKIEASPKKPFSIRIEEIPGWFITPLVGDKSSFAFYDDPDGRLTGISTMNCIQNAEIHGVPCVQVEVEEQDEDGLSNRTLFLRMTETHCMYIAEINIRNGTFYFGSFLDDEWLERYEIGENNCGREIFQEAKGIAKIDEDGNLSIKQEEVPDVIGRYTVTIGDRTFDTVALATMENALLVIQYVDQTGKTVLFRRYNKFDWKFERYKQLWTEKLPNSEKIIVNGETYVHWYDCLTDYVL